MNAEAYYPDHAKMVALTFEIAASRLAFRLGTRWHLVGDISADTETEYGTFAISRPMLREAVVAMARQALLRGQTINVARITTSALSGNEVGKLSRLERVERLFACRRLFSAGVFDVETVHKAAEDVAHSITRDHVGPGVFLNLTWDILDFLMASLGKCLPPAYLKLVEDLEFLEEETRSASMDRRLADFGDREAIEAFAVAVEDFLRL